MTDHPSRKFKEIIRLTDSTRKVTSRQGELLQDFVNTSVFDTHNPKRNGLVKIITRCLINNPLDWLEEAMKVIDQEGKRKYFGLNQSYQKCIRNYLISRDPFLRRRTKLLKFEKDAKASTDVWAKLCLEIINVDLKELEVPFLEIRDAFEDLAKEELRKKINHN